MYRGNGYIEQHYPTMELEQITALPVKELVDKNAILFLWTTLPMIQEALQVIKAFSMTFSAPVMSSILTMTITVICTAARTSET